MEQLTLEDAARQWHITRLSRSLERWRATELDRILPDEYARYCATLAHLEGGGAYVIRDVTEDLLKECAKGIHASVMASDRATRIRRGQEATRKRGRKEVMPV